MLNTLKNSKMFSPGFTPGIKSVFDIIFLLCIVFPAKTQENLVPNGSFEEYNWCPDYTNGYYITACKYWNMPTLGSSDYFNSCSTDTGSNTFPQFGVPQNYIGHQDARTGNGYAGLVFVQDEIGSQTNSEYIQVKLEKQLEAGKFYHLQFYINCSQLVIGGTQPVCPNSIGTLLTPSELNINNYDIIPMTPQFQSDLNVFFCDTAKWFELNHTFQAVGNENYLTIGVFTPLPIIQVTDYTGNILSGASVYYYIDDVLLTEIDYISLIEGKIPNVFTPNGDGINDYFIFDNSLVQAKNLTILNRWGKIVFQSDNSFVWNGTYNELECTNGVYYYIIETENDIKLNGFLTLMR
jgi:gliding motility-associated-like protein